jgi:glycosyltransferase involved in cell wall biosynthesis
VDGGMTLRILFALPGLHRIERGAEVAVISIANELVRGGDEVTLIGSGASRPGTLYRYLHAGAVSRARFEALPRFPALRDDTSYEEASFVPGLLRQYRPRDYDVTVACSFPFVHWALRRPTLGLRPAHVFVTQNGDWPVRARNSEYRFFACDGLVCINPDYYDAGRARWPAALIPNGVALDRFSPGEPDRARFGLPAKGPVVLMVSALIGSKRVDEGVRAVANLPDVHLVCAGDGPERAEVDNLAGTLMPGRFTRLIAPAAEMPTLYRSCDAFLHLSLDEPFGNVFIEAMASGLPVVAHDSPRTRWVVGDDQFLCDSRDRAALSGSIARALAAAGDNDAAASRRAHAARYSWSSVAARYRDFFHEVVERRRSR